MASFKEFKKELFADAQLSEKDVQKLHDFLYDDEGMTREKGDFLFELKNSMSYDHTPENFKVLFVEAISILLLEDDISPGEIDDSEARWLRARMQSKGYPDRLNRRLLDNLKKKSINFPEILHYKGKYTRMFENTLYFSRYLTIFAVIASIISSVILFIKGTLVAIGTLSLFVGKTDVGNSLIVTDAKALGDYEEILVGFISSVDIYLFAMVLLIFGMGIYELFINKIDPIERQTDERPSWLQVSSIDDLKSSLGKVILMVLIVNFFKYTIDAHNAFSESLDLLYLAIGVVLVSLALFIANKSHGIGTAEKE